MEAETASMPNIADMISFLSDAVGIDQSQAKGKAAVEAVLKADPGVLQYEGNLVTVVDLSANSVNFLV